MGDRVVLAEDELFVALDVQMTIEDAGLSVAGPYASLAELEAAFDAMPIDELACAVLDVQLLDGEVFPAADRLAAAGVPIIFHSGHADPGALTRRYPAATICGKPCAPSSLRSALRTMTAARAGR